jgi:thymidylate synthase
MTRFENANAAFVYYYYLIQKYGTRIENTQALLNVGFYIDNPMDYEITCDFRNWNAVYAEKEWQWYLSEDPSVKEISRSAPIWLRHMDSAGNVNSNYGNLWNKGNQLEYVIRELKRNPSSRRALLTLYDAKQNSAYTHDTPCTLNIGFTIADNKLNMTVMMRSNDLWYGFSNDQYCFSKLQELVAGRLSLEIGWYFHFANNLHLYDNKLKKDE